MSRAFEYSDHADYRLLDRDRIEVCELYAEPDPSRLRTACLMIYAGLLLSLGAVLSSIPANAGPCDCPATGNRSSAAIAATPDAAFSIPAERRGAVGYGDGMPGKVPICGRNCRVPSRSPGH